MQALWALHIGALLAVVAAQGLDDYAPLTEGLDDYDPLTDLDSYPELQRGLTEYRHHRQYRPSFRARHHKMALTHHSASPRLDWSPDDDAQVAQQAVAGMPREGRMLLGRYPSVEKALDGMGGELNDLKAKQQAAKQSRGEFEGQVRDASHHMNDAMSIRHAIGRKEAELRKEKNKFMGLRHEAEHIEETHSSLVNSLHRVLEPKLRYAEQRLHKKEVVLAGEEKKAKGWQEKKDQLHEHALELLKEKKVVHQSMLQAEQEVVEAKKREETARIKYEQERRKTGQEVQSFRYAETRYKAEVTHEKVAAEAAIQAKKSVEKLGKVMRVESEKVERSIVVNKHRIHQKMEKIEIAREKSEHELRILEGQYHEWKELQRERAAQVVRKGRETAMAAEEYAARQRQVLDSAQTKVVHDVERKSDWALENGFTDATPTLSD